ncbi:MAG TPA: glutaminase A [Ornithinibacter sp.]|nr:glutaminase A [Ornithinibacter sp.]
MSERATEEERYVSTGHLPRDERVQAVVERCHRELAGVVEGAVSDVYPVLAQADPSLFGVAMIGVDGHEFLAGDVDVPFALMSVAKPFVFALACEHQGIDALVDHVGVDATGRAFNSLAAVEASADGRTNPMVNPGAIACTGMLAGPGGVRGVEVAWDELRGGMSAFAGRDLSLDEAALASARTSNQRNRAIAQLLHSLGRLPDPDLALDLYTRQSCLAVTARDLAVMGATLADGGVNPVSGERVVGAEVAARTLAVMTTAGLYETSGQWLVRVGLPGKSGIGGGIVTAAPGKGGLGTFSPPLDAAGNSVRGVLAAARLSRELGLDLFGSAAVGRAP